MDTDALILALARDATRVPRRAVANGLAMGLTVGAAAAIVLAVGGLGVRPDLASAVATASFWAKAGFTVSTAGIGLVLTAQLSRPDSRRLRGWWLVAIPIIWFIGLAGDELWLAISSGARAGLLFGPRWLCPLHILMLSVPVFLGLSSAMQRMAPTRLRAAGAAAGLAAGGLAATVYALVCEEASPAYILSRYTLAVALAAAAGALLGPRLLRW